MKLKTPQCAICQTDITPDNGHYVAPINHGKKWTNVRFCAKCNEDQVKVKTKIKEAEVALKGKQTKNKNIKITEAA